MHSFFKFLHVMGVVLLLGNAIVTAVWKGYADRTRAPLTVAYAQRLVILTDWLFTGGGIVLIVFGGYAMAQESRLPLLRTPWLAWGQGLFILSAIIWAVVLLPTQAAQSRMARGFKPDVEIPARYWQLGRRWLAWGVLATLPLLLAVYVMIARI
jgi:uncharacterized membrane protein